MNFHNSPKFTNQYLEAGLQALRLSVLVKNDVAKSKCAFINITGNKLKRLQRLNRKQKRAKQAMAGGGRPKVKTII